MNVLVFGAAGKTGKAVVEQAVAAGHEVTAFVRNAAEGTAPNVRMAVGDATNRANVDAAMREQEAVIDTIGGKTPYKTTTLESSAASTIIASMQANGVRRLLAMSMLGIGESKENTSIYVRLLVSTFLRGADKDKIAMEAEVQTSGLDWTIFRPAILTDDAATGSVRVYSSETGEKAHEITRADLAAFMVEQLSSSQYAHQSITVASR